MAERKRLAILLIIICYLGWGTGMTAMKFALESFSPVQIMTARVVIPALFYLISLRKWPASGIRSEDWKYFLLLGACEPCLFFFCVTTAMSFTSASEGSVISACLPLLIAFGARLFLKEPLPGKALFWLCLAIWGVMGLSFFSKATGNAPNPVLGNSLMLAGICFSAGYTLLARKLSQNYSGIVISFFQAIMGCVVFVPLCFVQEWPGEIKAAAWIALLWLGIGVGFGVYLAFNQAMKWVDAGMAGILSNLTPIAGLALASVVLGEKLAAPQWACCLATLFAVFMAGKAMARKY